MTRQLLASAWHNDDHGLNSGCDALGVRARLKGEHHVRLHDGQVMGRETRHLMKSVFDTTLYQGQSGRWQVGGTSASTPMWAARAADAGVLVDSAYVYANQALVPFRDITSGGNGCPVSRTDSQSQPG